MKTYSKSDLERIAENALNAACESMQNEIGVKTGDYAGIHFTGEIEAHIYAIFEQYLRNEISFMDAN